MNNESLKLELNVTSDQAYELAQFVKRVRFDQIRDCAISEENAYTMRDAIVELQKALDAAGYSPR